MARDSYLYANLYDELDRAIAAERSALPSSGVPEDSTTWPSGEQELLVELIGQHNTVQAHRVKEDTEVLDKPMVFCLACGEPRPCTAIRVLTAQYGVRGESGLSHAMRHTMGSEATEGDKVGLCACGLRGRQDHVKVSRPGQQPEAWIRSEFECAPTRPGPHLRLS